MQKKALVILKINTNFIIVYCVQERLTTGTIIGVKYIALI